MDFILALPSELLVLWHEHRVEVIIIAGIVLTAARWTAQLRRVRRHNFTASTTPTPPAHFDIDRRETPRVDEGGRSEKEKEQRNELAKQPHTPRRVKGVKKNRTNAAHAPASPIHHIQPYIFYFSLAGSTRARAEKLAASLSTNSTLLPPVLHDLTEVDYDDYFVQPPSSLPSPNVAAFYLLLIPTYNIDTELDPFLSHLEDTHHDFRIDTAPLSRLAGYSVFGLGDQTEWPTEADGFCTQALQVDKWMARLTSRKRAYPVGLAHIHAHDLDARIHDWTRGNTEVMAALTRGEGLGEGAAGSGDAIESDDEVAASADNIRAAAADLEDIQAPIPVDFTTAFKRSDATPAAPKPMVPTTSPTYNSLTKQGYTIVGTHSGVKTCRWTKSALRGRGSCYKFSFYGIASHQCMEATPSLSCSNKCVFCWRHGTNPVGTTWRWQVDEPDLIFDGIKKGHYQKIKQMRGVPGVRAERFAEAMRIRHCALSLVGEPIFYPHINKLLAMLHAEHISSFLVCNAQHPDQLATLGPVTQLYVSIDASDKESLRRIDRPLHRDFWERFIRCMDILREKRNTHRTVFRLTLVKGFNIDEEAKGYANLVERALPGFVEVKGVTYCGTTTAAGAGLTMQNVPFYDEVCAFVLALEKELNSRGLEYGIGAEHAHSCCILLADRKRFQINDGNGATRWHTLIDYPAFFRCVESGLPFGPEDYIGGPTPEWASWGNGGFDPRDERVDRKGRPKDVKELPIARVVEI